MQANLLGEVCCPQPAGLGGFTQPEVNLLARSINKKFGLYNKSKGSKVYYNIYIPAKDLERVKALVSPYFFSSMSKNL